ncbi:DUF3558 family protein [Corynebacterium lubricantis]|uniref:DUF3558 family protein n=1 Tax=Corynebacterium lubricantis TaxID=541095 RepID=UPI00037D5FE1|nr:DUF3558 family protein [Corynebacterium lubricantis]
MKSRILTMVLTCTFAITGCTSAANSTLDEEPTTSLSDDSVVPQSTTEEESAQAFHFESGVLPIGDFNPEEVYPDVFNPCEEISAEEFAAIGYEVRGETQSRGQGSLLSCRIQNGTENDLTILIEGSLAAFEDFEAQGEILSTHPETQLAGMVLYRSQQDDPASCRAAVPTYRGHLTVSVQKGLTNKSVPELCTSATEILNTLHSTYST